MRRVSTVLVLLLALAVATNLPTFLPRAAAAKDGGRGGKGSEDGAGGGGNGGEGYGGGPGAGMGTAAHSATRLYAGVISDTCDAMLAYGWRPASRPDAGLPYGWGRSDFAALYWSGVTAGTLAFVGLPPQTVLAVATEDVGDVLLGARQMGLRAELPDVQRLLRRDRALVRADAGQPTGEPMLRLAIGEPGREDAGRAQGRAGAVTP